MDVITRAHMWSRMYDPSRRSCFSFSAVYVSFKGRKQMATVTPAVGSSLSKSLLGFIGVFSHCIAETYSSVAWPK